MATTNIDAVAEFKILTNAYQAEYGRAVGGQLQVVTKSGTQRLPRLRLLVRTALGRGTPTPDLNKRETPEIPKPKTSRNDSGYTFGGPVFVPGLQRGQEEAVLLLEPGIPAAHAIRPTVHQTRVPTALERRGDFSQSVDSSGNPFPYIRDFTHRPAVQRRPTRAAASRTAACSAGFPRTGSMRPASPSLNIFPARELLGRQRPELHEPGPRQRAAPRRPAAHGLPGDRQLAGHRPLHEEPRKTSCRRTGRRGPATAAISSRRRRCSCIPARTTCCPRPAS